MRHILTYVTSYVTSYFPCTCYCIKSLKLALNIETLKMPKKKSKKMCHDDIRGTLCICCLLKLKTKCPKKLDDTLSSLIVSKVYPEFLTHRDYLPTAICTTCIDKVKSESEIFPLVKYVELVENVKVCQINVNSGENVNCICELCRLGAVTALNIKVETSEFLINTRNKVGRPPIAKPIKVTDLIPDNNKTKDEKLNEIAQNASPSLHQLCAIVMRNQVKHLKISHRTINNL